MVEGSGVSRIGTFEDVAAAAGGSSRTTQHGGRRKRPGWPLKTLYYVLLTAASLIMSLPFFWLLSTSLTARGLEFQIPPQWIPNPIVWHNYYEATFESGLPFP